MMLGTRFVIFKLLVTTMLLIAFSGNQSAAQTIIYPHSYPSSHSYPASSYPASSYPASSYPTTYPSGSYLAPSQAVGNQDSRIVSPNDAYSTTDRRDLSEQNRYTAPQSSFDSASASTSPSSSSRSSVSTFTQQPSVSQNAFETTSPRLSSRSSDLNNQRDAVTRLASTGSLSSGALNSDSLRPTVDSRSTGWREIEPVSLYAPSQIQAARDTAAQFRRMAQSVPDVAAKIAQENADFVDQWTQLAEAYQSLSDRVSKLASKLNSTKRDYQDVRTKLDHYGLTPTVGLLLRHKKEQLDTWQVNESVTLFVTEELGRSRQQQLELEMVRYDGANANSQTDEILTAAGLDPSSVQSVVVASQVRSLLQQRQQWLTVLGQGYQDYQRKLGELDSTTTESVTLTNQYRKLIDRHVTWIRSGDPIGLEDVRNLGDGLGALFDFRRSSELGYSIKQKWQANPVGGIGLLVWIVLISVARWRTKSWLIDIGNRKRMRDATPDSRKLATGVLTTLVAAAFPALLYVIARWLGSGIVSELTLQTSSGFYAASLVALLVEVPRQLLRSYGYIDKYVAIELPGRERATAYLVLIGFGLVLAAYVVTLMSLLDHGLWRDSVARFGFIAAMLVVAWTAHLSLRPTGGFLEPFIAKFGGSVIHRVRFVIYIAGVGFPLAMVVLSSLGYGYTANEFVQRAIITLVSLMIAATLWSGVKIASAHLWQMLTGTASPQQYDEYGRIPAGTTAGSQVTGVLGEHFLELKHHLAFLCQCALVVGAMVSFGWLWIDVFPNVRMGNPVVWTVQDTVTVSSLDAAGQTVTSSVIENTPITALHLLLAAATLFVAFQLAKLLPALFDALVLQRVSFDEGMEHFTLVLGRCLLFGVGALVACQWVGLRWHTIQWLAVGLTIGLGFGLQDMVRNLFGGLIVLFEKPARLGDLITVGRVTGRVASQKFRTTVLSDDEGREVIIPNKNFVSEDVVNWMGAGRLNVIPIEVAVNRDERPADICRTLQELVIDQPDVLLTPAPQATLVCVGKTSQRIEVRAWIEEGQDPSRFRDSLLKIVKQFLREKELLVATQPTQPAIREASEEEMLSGNYRSRSSRTRKRSA